MIKVGILGMGALGNALWVHLRAGGLRPVILSRRMNRFTPGTRLRAADGLRFAIEPEDLYAGEDLDLLFVTWSLQDNERVSRCIDPRAARWVVSLQNGLSKNASLGAIFPPGAVLRGCTGLAAAQTIDGTVTVTQRGCTFIEERTEALGVLEELAAAFAFGGLRLRLVPDAASHELTRQGLCLAFEPLAALTMMSLQKLWTSPPLAEQAVHMLREFERLVRAAGGALSTDPDWGFEMDKLLHGAMDEAVNSLAAKGRSLLRDSAPPIASTLVPGHCPRTKGEMQAMFEPLLELARAHACPIPRIAAACEAIRSLEIEARH